MPTSLTILSDNSEYLEFQELREAGIRHLGNLSGKIWTDHNLHDPGITILEMLCYALTDLGYRTSFDIQDLLAQREKGKSEDNFFTAAEILGCNPLTPLDYRKLLIDIDGVRNAWLEPVTSAQVAIQSAANNPVIILVVDLLEGKLKSIEAGAFDKNIHRKIFLNGLYRVYIELEHLRPVVTQDSAQYTLNRENILHQVRQTLWEHRNFCEDFLDIVILEDEKIGICADLELAPDANPDEVLQDLYGTVQEFLSPSIPFHTLEEMLNRKKTPEEIFEGRPLRSASHGFIDTDELNAIERREAVFISDVYQEILKDTRIRAIRNLHLSTYWTKQATMDAGTIEQQCPDAPWNPAGSNPDTDSPKETGKEWVLRLNRDTHRPVLSPDHSSIVFYKGPIPLKADERRAKEVFENRLANFRKNLLSEQYLDFAIPQGEFRELDDYLSIQHEFPLVYGIGVGGLAQTAPAKRKAQALQLQAYLTFYDQLLANYLSQLANIRQLFSFRPTEGFPSTYFSQALLDTPKGEKLIRFFNARAGEVPLPDDSLPYSAGEIIAIAAEVYESPEAREELIFKTIQAFRERTALASVYPEATNGSKSKFRFLIKNKANDKLLLSAKTFPDQESAMLEASALLLMRIDERQFRRTDVQPFQRTDEDKWQQTGSYQHEHGFKLSFRPDDYLSMLERFAENETTFYERRNRFLDHLLGRFSEKFTDYVLLMYALDGQRRDEREIIEDKERFLQHYPLISRKRGRGFDYSDLRLAKTCTPGPFILPEQGADKLVLPDPPKQEGDYRFQLVELESSKVLFISNKKNYTRTAAESESRTILKDLLAHPDYRFLYPENPAACIQIVRDIKVPVETETPENPAAASTPQRPKKQVIQEILAVTPFSLAKLPAITGENDLEKAKKHLTNLFSTGQTVYELKQADNTSGLERRVAALMGLDDWQRLTLSYMDISLQRKNRYGFQVVDTQGRVLLESWQHDYTALLAGREGKNMIRQLKADWNGPEYRVRPLPDPSEGQSPEYIYRIDVVKITGNEAPVRIAIHPETFGAAATRDARLQEIRDAIEKGQTTTNAVEAELIPFFSLQNDAGESILNGLMPLKDLEHIKEIVRTATNKKAERKRLLTEKVNEFLRLLGNGKAEYMFFVDPFEDEYYDFRVVHQDFRVARHPHIFQHKFLREHVRDELIAYAAGADRKTLYTELKFGLKTISTAQVAALFLDENAPSGESKEMWQTEEYFPDEACARLFYDYYFMDVVEAARELANYTIEIGRNGRQVILLDVPLNQAGEKIRLSCPHTFPDHESAVRKAEYLRQRARLFPIRRIDNGYGFYLYRNSPVPDFSNGNGPDDLREKWNYNWEDRILWQGLRTFSSLQTAMMYFRGDPPVPDPCAAPFGRASFLDLIRQSRNYERMETNDELGQRDDLGPFNLEIVDPGKILAETPMDYRIVQERKDAFNDVEAHLFREGFHVVEHILLRPSIEPYGYPLGFSEQDQDQADYLLDLCTICNGVNPVQLPLRTDEYLPLTDPFSHWATVVLPFWPRRFQNINFRKFFEETLRRESPAHVALRIAWVDPIAMRQFENVYKNWLKALATRADNILAIRNELLDVLFKLENVYPETNFSDTTAGEGNEDGIVLDYSKLI